MLDSATNFYRSKSNLARPF